MTPTPYVEEGFCRVCHDTGPVGTRCRDCGESGYVRRRGLSRPVSPFQVVAELVYDADEHILLTITNEGITVQP